MEKYILTEDTHFLQENFPQMYGQMKKPFMSYPVCSQTAAPGPHITACVVRKGIEDTAAVVRVEDLVKEKLELPELTQDGRITEKKHIIINNWKNWGENFVNSKKNLKNAYSLVADCFTGEILLRTDLTCSSNLSTLGSIMSHNYLAYDERYGLIYVGKRCLNNERRYYNKVAEMIDHIVVENMMGSRKTFNIFTFENYHGVLVAHKYDYTVLRSHLHHKIPTIAREVKRYYITPEEFLELSYTGNVTRYTRRDASTLIYLFGNDLSGYSGIIENDILRLDVQNPLSVNLEETSFFKLLKLRGGNFSLSWLVKAWASIYDKDTIFSYVPEHIIADVKGEQKEAILIEDNRLLYIDKKRCYRFRKNDLTGEFVSDRRTMKADQLWLNASHFEKLINSRFMERPVLLKKALGTSGCISFLQLVLIFRTPVLEKLLLLGYENAVTELLSYRVNLNYLPGVKKRDLYSSEIPDNILQIMTDNVSRFFRFHIDMGSEAPLYKIFHVPKKIFSTMPKNITISDMIKLGGQASYLKAHGISENELPGYIVFWQNKQPYLNEYQDKDTLFLYRLYKHAQRQNHTTQKVKYDVAKFGGIMQLYIDSRRQLEQAMNFQNHMAETIDGYKKSDYDDFPNIKIKNLKRVHDRIARDARAYQMLKKPDKDRIINKKISAFVSTEPYQRNLYSDKHYQIQPVIDSDSLIYEGQFLSHCVAGYVNSVAEQKSYIYFLRRSAAPNTPFVTIELKAVSENGSTEFSLLQCYTHNDSTTLPKETIRFIKEWMETKKITSFGMFERLINGGHDDLLNVPDKEGVGLSFFKEKMAAMQDENAEKPMKTLKSKV